MKVLHLLVRLVASCTVCVACGSPVTKIRGGMTPECRENERACQQGNIQRCTALGRTLIEDDKHESSESHGVVLLEMACGADDNEACAVLGKYYARSIQSTPRGKMLLERACAKRHAQACVTLGDIAANSDQADPTGAIGFYKNACQQGDAEGCERLGIALYSNEFSGSKMDALAAFANACRTGRASSCHYVAMTKLRSETERDEGLSLLEENCKNKIVASCTAIASYWAPIVGNRSSCEKAIPFAKESCRMSNVEGCAILSACVLSDSNESDAQLNSLEKGCVQGIGLSCFYWANFQQAKPTLVLGTSRVREAYDKACRSPSIASGHACVRLTILDLAGKQSPIDTEQPFQFLRKACGASFAEACCFLSREHASGERTKPDPVMASELASKACELGYSACCVDTKASVF